MKNIVIISLATIIVTGCCNLIQYDQNFPVILLELQDETMGEDLFINGTLSIDSINISNTDYPNQSFNVIEQVDKTIIQFGPGQSVYTITVGDNVTFSLTTQTKLDEHRCYSEKTVTAVSIEPYNYQAIAVENTKEWSVIVSIN